MEINLIIVLSILTLALTFWALVDIVKSRFKDPFMRIIWLIIVLFIPILGPIFYFQLRRNLKSKEKRVFQPHFNR